MAWRFTYDQLTTSHSYVVATFNLRDPFDGQYTLIEITRMTFFPTIFFYLLFIKEMLLLLKETFSGFTLAYPYLPTPPLGQDMTEGQFLSGVSQVWIQSFPSPRLVASPRLKNPDCPTIYP